MSRSADGARALRTVLAAVVGLGAPGILTALPAGAGPAAVTSAVTSATDVAGAEVLGITAVVLDIGAEVESIDGVRAERSTPTEQTVILTSDVLFAVGSADLTAEAVAAVQSLAAEMVAADVSGVVRVDGHTDDQSGDAFNLDLSRRRADSVAAVLGPALAGASVQLETEGFGEARPRVPNLDADGDPIPENQARNRRVEITTSTG